MTALVDTNVIIRHLTGDPPRQARRATKFLGSGVDLFLLDVIAAEIVYVLESFYEVTPPRVAEMLRAVVTFDPIKSLDQGLLLRALEIYETTEIDFADAYVAANAEVSGVQQIASFDRHFDRLPGVERVEP